MAFVFGHSSLGDFAPGATIYLKFTTTNASGVPTAWATSQLIDIYKTNSTTQSTAGLTIVVSFDGIPGLNHVTIDTSADATFYAAGGDFQVVISDGDVGGVSLVGYVVANFSLNHVAALRPTTAGNTLDVAATGEAGLDFSNLKAASAPTTLTNITVPAVTAVSGSVGSVTGAVGSVTGSVAGNVTGNVGGNIVGNLQGTLSTTERNAIADAWLLRDQTLVTPPALNARVPLNALRNLNCGISIAAGVMTIYAEDGVTPAMTINLTTDAAAVPITGAAVSP